MTNPLSSFAHRTARWCALHPWRAILGWVAFVALAVGLATLIPTQETTDADPLAGHGRGLQLVEMLTSRWGSELDADGMTVWCELEMG